MKNFKKWWNNLLCSNNENFRIVAESSWRAAMKEVLKQLNNIYDGDFENSEIVSWIKKELNT